MPHVIIVGGGLFGSIAARSLTDAGMKVQIIDDERPYSGSKAAGCLMKPSWLSKMGRENVEASFRLLDRLYGLTTIQIHAGPTIVNAEWVNPDLVLNDSHRLNKRVMSVEAGRVTLEDGSVLRAPVIIVAAGAWTRQLIPGCDVTGKIGVSIRLDNPVEDNRISVWAPYKQLVRFSEGNFHWSGDGTAIISRNWTAEHRRRCKARISDFAGSGEVRQGVRPYVKTSDPADLKEVVPGLWSLTGGGKNGTAAAGWAAARLVEILT